MSIQIQRLWFAIGLSLFITGIAFSAGIQWKGSFYNQAYGYQSTDPLTTNTDTHFWLFSGVNSSINNLPGGWRFLSNVQYRGDQNDKFSTSGQSNLYAANLSYGDFTSPWSANIGRFFLYRGVAVGTIDGMEVSRDYDRFGLAVFGGSNVPENRDFALAKGNSPFFGGEVKYLWKNAPLIADQAWKVSYADQLRDGDEYRRLVGLQLYGKFNPNWTILGSAQYRLLSQDFRQASVRFRYYSPNITGYLEGGVLAPEIAAYSWFNNFDLPAVTRVRGAFDYFFIPAQWSAGVEATMTSVQGASGFRGGPVITTPYGQVGYRAASGDLSKSYGPWLSAWYNMDKQLRLYANSSVVDYAWDGVNLVKGQVTTASLGGNYTAVKYDWVTLGGEYQYFKTPELKSDRRALGSLTFHFSTGGSK